MKVMSAAIPDVLVVEPTVFGDERGFFMETYNRRELREAAGIDPEFVQDNHSRSQHGVLRGLHYQIGRPQGKLVRVASGRVFDVAVDLRRGSPHFGRPVCLEISAEDRRMVWIPPGFAHGFLVLSEAADFLYKTTDYYVPGSERTLLWSDPALGIPWPLQAAPVLSAKDRRGTPLAQAETYA